MVCDSNCSMCITGNQSVLILDTVNYPSSADYGAYITISGQIQKSWTNFESYTPCLVCIMDGTNCLASSTVNIILPGSVVNFSLPINMPNRDVNINITVKAGLFSYQCADTKSFVIKVNRYYNCIGGACIQSYIPGPFTSQDACISSGCKPAPMTYTDFNCVSNVCTNVATGTGQYSSLKACTDTGCKAPGGGTNVCSTDQTNLYGLLGKCYPKTDVYIGIGALAFAYMLLKR